MLAVAIQSVKRNKSTGPIATSGELRNCQIAEREPLPSPALAHSVLTRTWTPG